MHPDASVQGVVNFLDNFPLFFNVTSKNSLNVFT